MCDRWSDDVRLSSVARDGAPEHDVVAVSYFCEFLTVKSPIANLLMLVTHDRDTAVSARAGREKSVEGKLDAESERNYSATLRQLVRDRFRG